MNIDFNAIVSNWLDETIKNVKEQHPDVPEDYITLFRETILKNLDIENMRNHYAAVYKRYFSQEEISRFIAFYENPLGKKSAKVNPQITQESMVHCQAYIDSLVKEVLEEIFTDD